MNSKAVWIVGCLVLITTLGDNITGADKIVPKLYEEIGCTEINEPNSDNGLAR